MPESELPQESIELARLQEAYGGKYIATRGDEVIASAGNLRCQHKVVRRWQLTPSEADRPSRGVRNPSTRFARSGYVAF